MNCSAVQVSLDFLSLAISPINCSTVYKSHVLCVSTYMNQIFGTDIGYTKPEVQNKQMPYGGYIFSGSKLVPDQTLQCPHGFWILFDNKCLKTVTVNSSIPCLKYPLWDLLNYRDIYGSEDNCDHVKSFKLENIDPMNDTCKHIHPNAHLYDDVRTKTLIKSPDKILNDLLADFYVGIGAIVSATLKRTITDRAGRRCDHFGCKFYQRLYLDSYSSDEYFALCEIEMEEVVHTSASSVPLVSDWFKCDDDILIPAVLTCDGHQHCEYGEDESHMACQQVFSKMPLQQCTSEECKCRNRSFFPCLTSNLTSSLTLSLSWSNNCVPVDHVCDNIPHCPNREDERHCAKTHHRFIPRFKNEDVKLPPDSGDSLRCLSTQIAISSLSLCQYDSVDGVLAHCEDGSHLGTGLTCINITCTAGFKCRYSYCIPVRKVCDGFVDCPMGDDELEDSCGNYTCPGMLKCFKTNFCVAKHETCDGKAHCPGYEDEKYCQNCPQNCQCQGTAIRCTGLQKNQLFSVTKPLNKPSALIVDRTDTVLQYLCTHNPHNLQYLHILELSYGSLKEFYTNHTECMQEAFNVLKILHLHHQQQMHVLPEQFITAPFLILLNLSHNGLYSLEKNAFNQTPSIQVLSLQSNQLVNLEMHYFEGLEYLWQLYMQDNALIEIPSDVFSQSPSLSVLRSDWYMVCCVSQAQDCLPQNSFVSSCKNLISSDVQRLVLMLQAWLSFLCNISVLIYHGLFTRNMQPDFPLIISLSTSDCLMGCYLLGITLVDLSYRQVFYTIAAEWTRSILCKSLHLFNFLSSEVSLLTVCLLSIARVKSIDAIGGLRSISKQIRVACVLIWLLMIGTCIGYVLYISLQRLAINNNMCVIYAVSHQKRLTLTVETVLESILLLVNSLCLYFTCVSMVGILQVYLKSQKSLDKITSAKKRSNTKSIQVSIKILLVVTCNFLSWLPVLTVSLCLLLGVKVHEVVIQWVVILSLPISAVTDPILYNIAVFQYFKDKLKYLKDKIQNKI